MSTHSIVVAFSVLAFVGCGGDPKPTTTGGSNGSTNGSSTNGSSTNGSSTNGSSTNGSSTNGSSTNGSSTNGSSTTGSSNSTSTSTTTNGTTGTNSGKDCVDPSDLNGTDLPFTNGKPFTDQDCTSSTADQCPSGNCMQWSDHNGQHGKCFVYCDELQANPQPGQACSSFATCVAMAGGSQMCLPNILKLCSAGNSSTSGSTTSGSTTGTSGSSSNGSSNGSSGSGSSNGSSSGSSSSSTGGSCKANNSDCFDDSECCSMNCSFDQCAPQ